MHVVNTKNRWSGTLYRLYSTNSTLTEWEVEINAVVMKIDAVQIDTLGTDRMGIDTVRTDTTELTVGIGTVGIDIVGIETCSGDWHSVDWCNGNWHSGNLHNGNWHSGDWHSGDWHSGGYTELTANSLTIRSCLLARIRRGAPSKSGWRITFSVKVLCRKFYMHNETYHIHSWLTKPTNPLTNQITN